MKEIHGYVCVCKSNRDTTILFGKGLDGDKIRRYSNIESNNLVPYCSRGEAYTSKLQLKRRKDLSFKYIAKIEMRVAHSRRDLENIVDEDSFVVIKENKEGDKILYGPHPHLRGKGGLPGCPLISNGLKTYKQFGSAVHTADEINQQVGIRSRIATFYLERL